MLTRQSILLPTPWNGVTDAWILDRDEGPVLSWAPGAVVKVDGSRPVESTRRLASMLDEFCRIGSTDDPRWQQFRLLAFTKRWGAWGMCDCAGLHRLAPTMRPPKQRSFPKPPGYQPRTEQGVDQVVESARIVNSLRATTISLRLDQTPTAAQVGPLVAPFAAAERARLVGDPRTLAGLVDEWTRAWIAHCHVEADVPSLDTRESGNRWAVGGVAGALASAYRSERSAPPRTRICDTCGVTWAAFRDWDEETALDSRCRSCLAADRQPSRKGAPS